MKAHPDGQKRDEPSQRWWQGDDGYWYPPTPASTAATGPAVFMTASPRASVAAGTDQGGGGTPPSPPPTSSPPGRATRRARALSLAPWASRPAGRAPARDGEHSGGRVPSDDVLARRPSGEQQAAAARQVLPLWLCVGAPLVAVLVAFVAIAALTAPSDTNRSSAGLRTGAGDGSPATTADDRSGAPEVPASPQGTAPAAAAGDATPTTTVAPASDRAERTGDAGDADDEGPDDGAAPAAAPATTATTAAPAPVAPPAPARADDRPGVLVRPLLDDLEPAACHPSYLACVPVADDVDCRGDGEGPEHDGPEFSDRVVVIGPDEYRLDSDGDGIGCD